MSAPQIDKMVEKARGGDKEACWNLYLHYDEVGDKEKVLYWLKLGSSFGDAKAQYQLFAILKDSSNAIEKRIAIEELEKSANNNNSFAQLELGKEYINGTLIQINNENAKHWLTKSAFNGEIAAMLQLANLYFSVDHALVKAYAWTILANDVAKNNRAYDEDIKNIQKNITQYTIEHNNSIETLVKQAEIEAKKYKTSLSGSKP